MKTNETGIIKAFDSMISNKQMNNKTEFTKQLQAYRIKNGMVMGEMAEKIGLSSSQLSRIEQGLHPWTGRIRERVSAEYPDFDFVEKSDPDGSTADGKHYKKHIINDSDVGQPLDPAFIAHYFDMSAMQFTALKKVMAMGKRGNKSRKQDALDIIGAMQREIELIDMAGE